MKTDSAPTPKGKGSPDGEVQDPSASLVVKLENVSFHYGDQQVLQDVDLSVWERDFTSIVGPNGSGKTTLLKLVLGQLKPQNGRITVFEDRPEAARRRIGYIPQSAQLDSLFPVTVMDVVLMGRLSGLRLFGSYRKADREAVWATLEKVGLGDLAEKSFSQLSGGQRQRALIARALVSEPDLLILDEPTASLDVGVEEAFYELLKNLNEHMTILLVSHDLGFVSRYVKSVVCVKRVVRTHSTGELTVEAIREMYGDSMCVVRHDHS